VPRILLECPPPLPEPHHFAHKQFKIVRTIGAVFVPNFVGAKLGALDITPDNRQLLRSAYTRRRPEELAVLTRHEPLPGSAGFVCVCVCLCVCVCVCVCTCV
jgi:hypothetical protein